MLKLVNPEKPKDIQVGDMQDGDIAVITQWNAGQYIGRVVQRYGDYLISVGALMGHGWGKMFPADWPECRVRVLEKGETLVVGD